MRFRRHWVLAPWLVGLAACVGDSPFAFSGVDGPPGDDDVIGDDDTTEVIDCIDLPPLPTEQTFLDSVAPSEDFTFDSEGYLVHASVLDGGFRRTDHDGKYEILIPAVSTWPRGIRVLLDGDVVLANPDLAALQRLSFDGTKEMLSSTINDPNGVVIRSDGMIFVTTGVGQIWCVDPQTGAGQIVHQDSSWTYDGIAFDLAYETLYFNNEMGQIWAMPVSAECEAEDPVVLATIDLGEMDILDGMAVDACGNLYVVGMMGRVLRVSPDGIVEVFIEQLGEPMEEMIAAVNFGSGVGGWERDHLYVSSLINGVYEVEVGLPGRPEPHLP